MKYFAQEQAPQGGWYDALGSVEIDSCIGYAKWAAAGGRNARVVERKDSEVARFPAIAQQPKEREVA